MCVVDGKESGGNFGPMNDAIGGKDRVVAFGSTMDFFDSFVRPTTDWIIQIGVQ